MKNSIPYETVCLLIARNFAALQTLLRTVPSAVNVWIYEGRLVTPPEGVSRERWRAMVKNAALHGYPRFITGGILGGVISG
jgi:hypothetical protein